MISIFNGRERTLGGHFSEIYAQVSVDFRGYLHNFKGARLAVFVCIALHADENGWSRPGRGLIARETGYHQNTVSQAVADLCRMTVKGHRILLRHQEQTGDGTFTTNRYLVFPSQQEVEQFEAQQPELLPCKGFPYTAEPYTVEPCTVNLVTKDNQVEEEPAEEKKPASQQAAGPDTVLCSIHGKRMKRREKDGAAWHSHRLADGTWCKGAAGDEPREPEDRTRYISGEYGELIEH